MSLPDYIEKNFITNREPQKENLVGCSGVGQAMLWQIRDPWSGRQHESADGMIYVVGGEGSINIGGRDFTLNAGSFSVVPRGTTYGFTKRGRNPLIVLAAIVLFDMPMRGSWFDLIAVVSLFLVGALAFGLLISSIAESQQVAFQVALLTSFLPTLMLSGFIFPIASMPSFLQVVTRIVPARYFLVALRGIVLKGVGPADFWSDILALAVYAVVILGLASVRVRRQWA